MLELGPIAFATPAMLLALLLLPALWWLLRITPPMPRIVRFPPIRLLFGLRSKEETPASAPLWLILLRLAMATLLILGLAQPLLNPDGVRGGKGALLLVVDDGWAAAQDWDVRREALLNLVDRAARNEQPVILLPTAPDEAGRPPVPSGLLNAAEARAIAGAMEPKPWPTDRRAAAAGTERLSEMKIGYAVWLSDGLQDPGVDQLVDRVRHMAELRVMAEPAAALPPVLLPPEPGQIDLTASLVRADAGRAETLRLRLVGEDGRVLDGRPATFPAGEKETAATFEVPVELRNEAARIEIENGRTATSVALLDERWRRRPVGLVSTSPLDADLSLLDELYYLERALAPYGEVRRAPLEELIAGNRAAIILPDGQPLVSTQIEALDRWIRGGGLVLRFAGPRLAETGGEGLVPVQLRGGGRALGGAMLWTEPARLAPFTEDSPFQGLQIPADVRVARQVLAEPSLDLQSKTWARLKDGTPLVTAERRGEGWLVLIHTTANPEWSNLALSGLFVQMLERTVAMSSGVSGDEAGSRPMPPIEVLDARGRLTPAPSTAVPIEASEFGDAKPSPRTPPGYYGTDRSRRALNLGPAVAALAPLALPDGIARIPFELAAEISLKPWLLAAALILLLLDTLATFAIRSLSGRIVRGSGRAATATTAVALAILVSVLPRDAAAQTGGDADAFALQATDSTRLAFVLTGVESLDSVSRAGLEGLSLILNRRTAVETGNPVGVDPATDELAFFPLLYWPVSQDQPPLAPDTAARLNRYIENGGTILFDTRDGGYGGAGAGPGEQHLRVLARGLDIPRLIPVPVDHVLTKAFYLTQDFPGRWAGGTVWVEQAGERQNDGVSRIVVGSADWASAWAVDSSGIPMFPAVPGGEAQREMAYRFGVNLVMYTLTGNYKSDQVHVPAILERLGQ